MLLVIRASLLGSLFAGVCVGFAGVFFGFAGLFVGTVFFASYFCAVFGFFCGGSSVALLPSSSSLFGFFVELLLPEVPAFIVATGPLIPEHLHTLVKWSLPFQIEMTSAAPGCRVLISALVTYPDGEITKADVFSVVSQNQLIFASIAIALASRKFKPPNHKSEGRVSVATRSLKCDSALFVISKTKRSFSLSNFFIDRTAVGPGSAYSSSSSVSTPSI